MPTYFRRFRILNGTASTPVKKIQYRLHDDAPPGGPEHEAHRDNLLAQSFWQDTPPANQDSKDIRTLTIHELTVTIATVDYTLQRWHLYIPGPTELPQGDESFFIDTADVDVVDMTDSRVVARVTLTFGDQSYGTWISPELGPVT